MPTAISPSIHPSGLQGASAGPRGRNAEPSDGRSFGAALDRSRSASAPDARQAAEVSGTGTLAGRKTGRSEDKKSELSADDVMALLAPLSAPIVPAAAEARLTPDAAAKPGAAATADALASGAASPALPQDAATLAAASSKETPAGDAPQLSAQDGAQDAHAAKRATDRADGASLPLDTAAAAAAAAATSSGGGDTTAAAANAPALAPETASVIPPSADARSPVAAKPASAADANAAATAPFAAAPRATAAVEAAKPDAPAVHTDAASADATPDPAPQALAGLQASAAPALDRAAEPAKATPTLAVAPEVGTSEWGTAVGHQMIRMSTSGHQVAELNLNPANLGPLKVTLTMGDNQAQAMFVSAHESVRKAVEAALPQLRTTLAEQGISLGQTSVGAETRQPNGGSAFAEQNPQRSPGQPARTGSVATQPVAAAPSASTPRRTGAGLDTFA